MRFTFIALLCSIVFSCGLGAAHHPLRIEGPTFGGRWYQQTEGDGSESFYELNRSMGGSVARVTWKQEIVAQLPEAGRVLDISREDFDALLIQGFFSSQGVPLVRESSYFSEILMKRGVVSGKPRVPEAVSIVDIFAQEAALLLEGAVPTREFSLKCCTYNEDEAFVAKLVFEKTNRPHVCTVRLTTYVLHEAHPEQFAYFLISALFVPGKNLAILWRFFGAFFCVAGGAASISAGLQFIEEGNLIFFDAVSMQRVLKRNLLKTLAFTSVFLAGATMLVNDIYRDWEGPYCDLKQLKNSEEAADGVSDPAA